MAWFLFDEYGFKVSERTLSRVLKDAGWSRKQAIRRAKERSEELRQAWKVRQFDMPAWKVVCIDESAANERTGSRRYGWSLKGAPCYTDEPIKRSERWSILPAMDMNGYLPGTLIHQGSITAEIFEDWLETTILPQLEPGSILVMDNASIHRSEGVRELIESFDCILAFLPPYSPDFNPIESSFSVLKAWIKRHIAEYALYSNFEDFLRAALISIDDEMAAKWFQKCGYRSGL